MSGSVYFYMRILSKSKNKVPNRFINITESLRVKYGAEKVPLAVGIKAI